MGWQKHQFWGWSRMSKKRRSFLFLLRETIAFFVGSKCFQWTITLFDVIYYLVWSSTLYSDENKKWVQSFVDFLFSCYFLVQLMQLLYTKGNTYHKNIPSIDTNYSIHLVLRYIFKERRNPSSSMREFLNLK